METKLLGAALAVPLVAIGLIANTNSAEAASINGPGTFGLLGSVRVSGNAGDPGVTGDELFTYSFGRSTLIVDTLMVFRIRGNFWHATNARFTSR
ncbi:MAG: hypothetical protein HC784_15470 [Hydrococcus sp. CSU_1_8]|nr:hypothetical protein [Hydrococcus sp. CSU_1_8]